MGSDTIIYRPGLGFVTEYLREFWASRRLAGKS